MASDGLLCGQSWRSRDWGELPEPSVHGPICFRLGHRLPILPQGPAHAIWVNGSVWTQRLVPSSLKFPLHGLSCKLGKRGVCPHGTAISSKASWNQVIQ